jgi:hypothetical protein
VETLHLDPCRRRPPSFLDRSGAAAKPRRAVGLGPRRIEAKGGARAWSAVEGRGGAPDCWEEDWCLG